MTSQAHPDRPDGPAVRSVRAPRRAVRLSDTVGADESVLRATLPAPAPAAASVSRSPAASDSPDLVLARLLERAGDLDRSADDSGAGWGEGTDTNDDRLARDRPPHW
ncbi:hypothetical protein ACTHAM_002012 [Cellulomonas soli]|uniref:hypothetical protein n=1 Tax=Cellulomonas soli TaxID=931535 RepID=UPI003F831C67